MSRLRVPSTETYFLAHQGDRLAVEEIAMFQTRLNRRMQRTRILLFGSVIFQVVMITLAGPTTRLVLAVQLGVLVLSAGVWGLLQGRQAVPQVHVHVEVRQEPS